MTDKKIDEAYNVAIMLGLKGSDNDKWLFKRLLFQIASSAVDNARNEITTYLCDKSDSYLQKKS